MLLFSWATATLTTSEKWMDPMTLNSFVLNLVCNVTPFLSEKAKLTNYKWQKCAAIAFNAGRPCMLEQTSNCSMCLLLRVLAYYIHKQQQKQSSARSPRWEPRDKSLKGGCLSTSDGEIGRRKRSFLVFCKWKSTSHPTDTTLGFALAAKLLSLGVCSSVLNMPLFQMFPSDVSKSLWNTVGSLHGVTSVLLKWKRPPGPKNVHKGVVGMKRISPENTNISGAFVQKQNRSTSHCLFSPFNVLYVYTDTKKWVKRNIFAFPKTVLY